MAQQWYYADRQRQQRGPVSATELKAAVQRGEIDMSTLVWHEQLPAWVPLAQVAAQLGLAGAPPPMPPRAAPARREPPKRNGAKIALIVVGVLVACLVVFGGIIAAIAIPAYNDYTVRAKVSTARMMLMAERTAVAEFYLTNDRCPRNGDNGFKSADGYADRYLASVTFTSDGERCEIKGTLHNLGSRFDGGELVMRMDRQQNWTESSTLPNRYLPVSMRN